MRSPDPRRYVDRIVFITCCIVGLALVIQTSYQHGYDTAKAECKPIKTEVPLKNMTFKQQVRNIQWQFRDKGAVK